MKVKFSILIPAFKATFLYECIESILKQTYPNFEVIVLDDCSPYNIESIVLGFNDKRISYLKNEKRVGIFNLVDNWNTCLAKAKGDYIICMGDDDKLLPNCLQNYVEAIDSNPNIELFHIQTLFINEQSKVVDIQIPAPFKESVYSLMFGIWKGRETRIGDFLFKASTLREMGGFYKTPCAWHADRITVLHIAKENGIVNIPTPGFLFRLSSLAVTSNADVTVEKVNAWKNIALWYDNFLKEPPLESKDLYYYDYMKAHIKDFIHRRMMGDIIRDVQIKHRNVFYWVFYHRKYHLTKANVFTLITNSIRSFIA